MQLTNENGILVIGYWNNFEHDFKSNVNESILIRLHQVPFIPKLLRKEEEDSKK